jgi:hypothetical protein
LGRPAGLRKGIRREGRTAFTACSRPALFLGRRKTMKRAKKALGLLLYVFLFAVVQVLLFVVVLAASFIWSDYDLRYPLVFGAAYVGIGAIVVRFIGVTIDEMKAWLIARNSPDPNTILQFLRFLRSLQFSWWPIFLIWKYGNKAPQQQNRQSPG